LHLILKLCYANVTKLNYIVVDVLLNHISKFKGD